MAKNSHLGRNIAIGAAAGLALAAAAATAGAVLSNKKIRDNLGKKATEALKTVSKLALEIEKGAEGSLKVLKNNANLKLPKPKKAIKKSSK